MKMSYTLRTVQIVLNDDGSIRSARGDYIEAGPSGQDVAVGTKRIAAADLAAALPASASLIESVDALTVERDEALGKIEALEAERDTANSKSDSLATQVETLSAEVESLKAERDAAAADRDTFGAEVESLNSSLSVMRGNAESYAATRDSLGADLVKANEEIAALNVQIEALKAQIPPSNIVNGVPQIVSSYQARTALLQADLLDQVEAAVAASDDKQVQIAWEYATEFHRTSPFIVAIGAELNLTDAQVDALFIAAGQVT